MADQDAQDINQMMSATPEVVAAPKKSKFIWVVLGCVVMGIGLGVVVYQQSLKSNVKPTPTPKTVTTKPSTAPVVPPPVPLASPVAPQTNVVTVASNTMTFPKKGKLRVYTNLNNIQLALKIVTGGSSKTLTIPNKAINATTLMNSGDSTFEVEAGATGTVEAFLNSVSGPKLKGWVVPTDNNKKVCGVNGTEPIDYEPEMNFVTSKLAGETIFGWQCWEDDDEPGEFNDVYMLWTYVPNTTSTSPSPSTGTTVSPSPSASVKASASPSVKASASPSVKASSTATPTPSPRVVMPDTSEGTPVTGVFEVTVGTISVGLLLLILGLFSLLAL